MKRTLFIVIVIGLLLVPAIDLQAHHRGRVLPRIVRAGIAVAVIGHIASNFHRDAYDRHLYRDGRAIAREMRRNDARICKLEMRINRLERHYGSEWEIRRLEREIYSLQRRNDYLRSRLY
jgi:hypothetical protein